MKKTLLTAAFLLFSYIAQAQVVIPTSFTIALFPPGTTDFVSTVPVQQLTSNITDATCNQSLPTGWPAFGRTTPFILTEAPLTVATVWWEDTIVANRACAYPIFVWLNSFKNTLAAGNYPATIRFNAPSVASSAPTVLSVSFQRPAVVPTPLPPAATKAFRIVGL